MISIFKFKFIFTNNNIFIIIVKIDHMIDTSDGSYAQKEVIHIY